jgi:hypothetical protein
MNSRIKGLIIAIFLSTTHIYSQSSCNSGGSSSGGSGGSVSISIGQVANGSISGVNRNIAVGVQQAYSSSTVGITPIEDMEISLFPNPCYSELSVFHPDKLVIKEYEVVDLCGRILSSYEVNRKVVNINLSQIPPGTYFIQFLTEDQKIVKQKIIKLIP